MVDPGGNVSGGVQPELDRASTGTQQPVVVRVAVGADLRLLAPLERAAGERFRGVGMAAVADDDPPAIEQYEQAMVDGRLWVAELDGQVIGYVWAVDLDGQPHLEQISVLPEAGGQGIGIALVEQVVAWGLEQGGSSLTLSTFRDVRWNEPWYRRLGFVNIGAEELSTDQRWSILRSHEVAVGLDIEARTIMRRRFAHRP